jgi:hypothetical protein
MTVFSVEFPVKLNDEYTCQGREMPDGPFVAFDDLLYEGDVVAKFGDGEGNTWGPCGVVVRRDDGLWIEASDPEPPSVDVIGPLRHLQRLSTSA